MEESISDPPSSLNQEERDLVREIQENFPDLTSFFNQEKEEKERLKTELKIKKEQYIEQIRNKIQSLNKIYGKIKIDEIEKKLPAELRKTYKGILGSDLTLLIENMIINNDINAQIRGEYLTFFSEDLKERELKLKEQQLAETSYVGNLPDLTKKVLVFVSYATKDVELFKIKEIAEILTTHEKIEDVLYWQEDMAENIITYMNDNLGNCNVMLLFCSPNALKSKPVEKEWTSADMMNKPIVPIFIKPDHIPNLLKTRIGIEFDTFDLQKTIDEIYNLILKKIEKRIIDIKDLKTDF